MRRRTPLMTLDYKRGYLTAVGLPHLQGTGVITRVTPGDLDAFDRVRFLEKPGCLIRHALRAKVELTTAVATKCL